jgi:predicted double-glycine peptidase
MLACLRMVLAEGGTNPNQLVRLAERYGLSTEARELDLAAIRALVTQEQFPIVLLDRTILDGEFAIHAVIPIRFTRHSVTVLDPLRGERRLSLRKFAQAQRRVGWAVVGPARERPNGD